MNLMPDAVTVFIVTVFNSYSITEMASRLDFLFKKSKTQEFPTSWVFFCDEKNVITVTVLLV